MTQKMSYKWGSLYFLGVWTTCTPMQMPTNECWQDTFKSLQSNQILFRHGNVLFVKYFVLLFLVVMETYFSFPPHHQDQELETYEVQLHSKLSFFMWIQVDWDTFFSMAKKCSNHPEFTYIIHVHKTMI